MTDATTIRTRTPPIPAPARPRVPAGGRTAVPWLFAIGTVAVQIPYPLVHGDVRDGLTIASVLLFFAASATHAALTRGAVWAAGMVVIAAGTGLLAEAIGVHTGVPFGRYGYASTLGAKIAGVPVVVPLAWTMMAYPALLAGRRLGRVAGRSAAVPGALAAAVAAVTGGLLLAGWDLFLDPQMVAAGHWTWRGGGPALNGIPLSNALGWLVVGTALTAALLLLPDRDPPRGGDRLPFAMVGWTYASSLLANAAFFGRPGVAVAGGLGMGLVLALLVLTGSQFTGRR